MERDIYIIDDNGFTRDLCEHVLSANFPHHKVGSFASGEGFFDHYTEDKGAIIILDFNLDDGSCPEKITRDGLSVLRRLNARFVKSAVIMISGEETEGLKDEAIEDGALKYLCKGPDFTEQLLSTLQKLIG